MLALVALPMVPDHKYIGKLYMFMQHQPMCTFDIRHMHWVTEASTEMVKLVSQGKTGL